MRRYIDSARNSHQWRGVHNSLSVSDAMAHISTKCYAEILQRVICSTTRRNVPHERILDGFGSRLTCDIIKVSPRTNISCNENAVSCGVILGSFVRAVLFFLNVNDLKLEKVSGDYVCTFYELAFSVLSKVLFATETI